MWRLHHGITRYAQRVVPPVVGVEDDYVERFIFGRSETDECENEGKKKTFHVLDG
jgi:hypothetical protein